MRSNIEKLGVQVYPENKFGSCLRKYYLRILKLNLWDTLIVGI